MTLRVTSLGEDRFVVDEIARNRSNGKFYRAFVASVFWTGHDYAVEVPVRGPFREDDLRFLNIGHSRTFEGAIALLNGQDGFYA